MSVGRPPFGLWTARAVAGRGGSWWGVARRAAVRRLSARQCDIYRALAAPWPPTFPSSFNIRRPLSGGHLHGAGGRGGGRCAGCERPNRTSAWPVAPAGRGRDSRLSPLEVSKQDGRDPLLCLLLQPGTCLSMVRCWRHNNVKNLTQTNHCFCTSEDNNLLLRTPWPPPLYSPPSHCAPSFFACPKNHELQPKPASPDRCQFGAGAS